MTLETSSNRRVDERDGEESLREWGLEKGRHLKQTELLRAQTAREAEEPRKKSLAPWPLPAVVL